MRPGTDWKEEIPPDESARFAQYAEALRDLQRQRAKGGKASRGLHAKGVAGVEAEFVVLPNLPSWARVGLFAKPATYRAYVRYSNGSPFHQPDKKPDIRGIAIKLVGVEGRKLIAGLENAKTQDFLLIRNAVISFANADQFVGLVRARAKPGALLPWFVAQFGVFGTLRMLPKLAGAVKMPVNSLAATRYYSALPVKFGPYAVHWELNPHTVAEGAKPEDHGAELARRLQRGPVSYDLRAQFYCDAARTPIEDASVEWREADAPFVTLARLTLPQQNPASPRGQRVAAFVEQLSFDPWHATEDFRPLGNMMRARKEAYRLSTQERGAAGEPDGSERFDG